MSFITARTRKETICRSRSSSEPSPSAEPVDIRSATTAIRSRISRRSASSRTSRGRTPSSLGSSTGSPQHHFRPLRARLRCSCHPSDWRLRLFFIAVAEGFGWAAMPATRHRDGIDLYVNRSPIAFDIAERPPEDEAERPILDSSTRAWLAERWSRSQPKEAALDYTTEGEWRDPGREPPRDSRDARGLRMLYRDGSRRSNT